MNRPELTGEERARLRELVDAARRARLHRENAREGGQCSGCGADRNSYSVGCSTCWYRKSARRRRADPVLLERDRERWRQRKREYRARGRAA